MCAVPLQCLAAPGLPKANQARGEGNAEVLPSRNRAQGPAGTGAQGWEAGSTETGLLAGHHSEPEEIRKQAQHCYCWVSLQNSCVYTECAISPTLSKIEDTQKEKNTKEVLKVTYKISGRRKKKSQDSRAEAP